MKFVFIDLFMSIAAANGHHTLNIVATPIHFGIDFSD